MLGLRSGISVLLVTALTFSGIDAFAKSPFLKSQTAMEWRFVGITDTPYAPGTSSGNLGGLGIMNGLCAEEVATNSRMCFSAEVIRSTNIYGLEAAAWLMPSQRTVIYDPSSDSWFVYDSASGVFNVQSTPQNAASDLSCGANYSGSGSVFEGLTLDELGRIQSESCGSQRVACCAPVEIPVNPVE